MKQRRPRLAWWVSWTAFTAGVTASVAANIAHAEPTTSARLVAAWPPVALLLTVEMLSRVPAPRQRWFAAARYLATVVVALVAAIASYRHMAGLTLAVGEDALTAYTLPLSVDGTVVVASLCLLALSDVRRSSPDTQPVATSASPDDATVAAVPPAWPAAAPAQVSTLPLLPAHPRVVPATAPPAWPVTAPVGAPLLPLLPLLPATATSRPAAADPVSADVPATAPPTPAAAETGNSTAPALPRAATPRRPAPAGGYDQAEVDARKDAARRAYRDARAAGTPMSGQQLGELFGRSERWGRDRIAEVKTADLTPAGA